MLGCIDKRNRQLIQVVKPSKKSMFPLIYTSRLELRPALPFDCDILTNLWNEEDVKKYFWDGKFITASQVHDELEFCQSSFKEYGIGHWIMTIEDTTAIGSIGLLTYQDPFYDREILKKETCIVELIFAVFPSFRLQGFVTEATKSIIRYGFSVGFPSITAIADKPNIAAIRVLEKTGMKRIKNVAFKGQTVYIFRRRKK